MANQAAIDNQKSLSLEEELTFLQKIIDQQNNIIVISNGDELTMVNNQFLDFFAQPSLNAFKSEFGDISNTFVRHDRYFHMGKVAPGENWIEILKSKKDTDSIVSMVHLGEYEPKAFAVKISKLDEAEPYYVLTFTDITEFAIQANQYFYKATHDTTTGIYNRAYFSEQLQEIISQRTEDPICLVMFSLDDLKPFVEKHGNRKGDDVIKDMVDLVSMHLRGHDIFARLGRKEFALLLPKMEPERAEKLAENLRQAIGGMDTYTKDQVTATFGVATYQEGMQAESFINHLETLLATVKREGEERDTED